MSVVTVGNGCGPVGVEVGWAGRRSDSEGGAVGQGRGSRKPCMIGRPLGGGFSLFSDDIEPIWLGSCD
jgi:hypothetical protein